MTPDGDFEEIVEINGGSGERKLPVESLIRHYAAWPSLLVEGLGILRSEAQLSHRLQGYPCDVTTAGHAAI